MSENIKNHAKINNMQKFLKFISILLIISGIIGVFSGMGEWELSVVIGGGILIATGFTILHFRK